MNEPGATRGGPSGRKLLAMGLQALVVRDAAEVADCHGMAGAAAADPGSANAVIPATTSSRIGSLNQVGGVIGTPPIAW